jgi:hypothetical protein
MYEVQTVFTIGGENYSVEGSGQATVSAILEKFPLSRIILAGFLINGKFVKADLEPSFRYA